MRLLELLSKAEVIQLILESWWASIKEHRTISGVHGHHLTRIVSSSQEVAVVVACQLQRLFNQGWLANLVDFLFVVAPHTLCLFDHHPFLLQVELEHLPPTPHQTHCSRRSSPPRSPPPPTAAGRSARQSKRCSQVRLQRREYREPPTDCAGPRRARCRPVQVRT